MSDAPDHTEAPKDSDPNNELELSKAALEHKVPRDSQLADQQTTPPPQPRISGPTPVIQPPQPRTSEPTLTEQSKLRTDLQTAPITDELATSTAEQTEPLIDQQAESVAPVRKVDPMQGMKLEAILQELIGYFGWEEMGYRINIRCFNEDPSIGSSLKFLRKTPWARKKVDTLFLTMRAEQAEQAEQVSLPEPSIHQ